MSSTTSITSVLRHLWQQLQLRWHAPRLAGLHELDARALADMGVHVSEIGSIEAEWRGLSAGTRRRIAVGGRHV